MINPSFDSAQDDKGKKLRMTKERTQDDKGKKLKDDKGRNSG